MIGFDEDAVFDRERLTRLLGQPGLARLLDRLQKRIEQGGELGATVQLTAVSEEERRAVETLMGRPAGRGNSLRVSPAEVEELLRRCKAADNLRTALEVLRGPLRNRRAERDEVRAAWEELFAEFRDEVHTRGLGDWLEAIRTGGLLKRLAAGDPKRGNLLLQQALAVAGRLPARGITLSRLAAETLGDAHALDSGRPVATLVRRAVASRWDLPDEESPEGTRELWASAGVLVGGAVTSTVLVLNLPLRPESAAARALAEFAAEPLWLTLRQLLRSPLSLDAAGVDVFICENPAILAEAAEELGGASPPMVCTSGQRNSAVSTLLGELVRAGARLHYHGDFDRDGIAIANGIVARFGAKPWRFGTVDYLRAAPASSLPLGPSPPEALWDPKLAPAMIETGLAVHEEQVFAELLEDLRLSPDDR